MSAKNTYDGKTVCSRLCLADLDLWVSEQTLGAWRAMRADHRTAFDHCPKAMQAIRLEMRRTVQQAIWHTLVATVMVRTGGRLA